ncbi:hypothetical protein INT43_001915 [Umbelopsis isabellina]|uniref:Guanine nucleotide-binding protein-like 3 N-terminal domain-containing protein n=1 Tax=Mortierella isabellina TaxID=91625 RepID=A0A8H7PSF9_MORIS|nr:hypothetical protein INT43_001915 [Umbelopsis isabellina]
MPRRKVTSKRMSCAKRYKNEKRAKEHRRKLKKEAKKNPKHGILIFLLGSKKDPGIPNNWPFKEQLLNEIEERKQKMEQEKEDQKQQKREKKLRAKEAGKASSSSD